MSSSYIIMLIAFILIQPITGLAQEIAFREEEELLLLGEQEIMVTASRLEEPVERVPASVTVITRKEIERKHVITIDEVLRDVPGLVISAFGTMGEQTTPRIRGAEPTHLLIMIDGVVNNLPFDDFFDFSGYHVDNIERIEIIRGSYSALYGTDAIGGVINIITRKPDIKPNLFVAAEGGNFDTFREMAGVSNNLNNLRFIISASRTDSQGQFGRDEYNNTTISANLQYDISENSSLNLISRYIDRKKEIAVSVTTPVMLPLQGIFARDENFLIGGRKSINSLSFKKRVSDFWDFNVTGSAFIAKEFVNDSEDDGVSPPMATSTLDVLSERYILETQHNFYPAKWDTLTAGLVYRREQTDFETSTNLTFPGLEEFFPPHEAIRKHRTTQGFYLQNMVNLDDRFVLIAGGRYDHYDFWGSVFSPKVSSLYYIKSTKTKIKGNYGTGFHAPSFLEQYVAVVGTTDLKPEKSKSFDLGLEQVLGDNFLKAGITYYHIDFTDRITVAFDSFQFENIEKSRSMGWEWYLKLNPLPNLALNLNYTRGRVVNLTTHERITSLPDYTLNFNADYSINKQFDINMDIHRVGRKLTPDFADVTGLDGEPVGIVNSAYTRVDLAATYRLFEGWKSLEEGEVYFSILNLFDVDYMDIPGAPSPGINFRIGLQAKM